MRKLFTTLFLSLVLVAGTGTVYADSHKGGNRGQHSTSMARPGSNSVKPGKGKPNVAHKPGNGHYKPGKGYHKPTHPRHPNRPARVAIPQYRYNLGDMVRYATRGYNDVAVWRVSGDTYLVKYRDGSRYYTRYLYPQTGVYGTPSLISVNWNPGSVWSLIPNVQLNINL